MWQNLFSLFLFNRHTHTVYFNSFIALCIIKIFDADYILFLKQIYKWYEAQYIEVTLYKTDSSSYGQAVYKYW